MATLVRSEHYGEAFGEGVTHKYVQDGKLFDKEGNEVDASGKVIDKAKPATPEKKVSQAEAQLKA